MEIKDEYEIKPTTICRACLSPENNLTIPSLLQDQENFLEIYKTCTSVDLTEVADLPPHICDSCISQTQQFNSFRKMCIQSHLTIQTVFTKSDAIKIDENEEIFIFHNLNVPAVTTEGESKETSIEEKLLEDSNNLAIPKEKTQGINENSTHGTERTFDDYKCSLCKKTFDEQSLLASHIANHHQPISSSCFIFACNRCDKSYRNMKNLETHIYTHVGLRPFKCEICPKAFTTETYLKIHLDCHNRRYLCCECGKSYGSRLMLNRHKIIIHGGKRPFPCELCPSSFVISADLARHMRTHNDERPYLCTICGKGFRRGYHLTVHNRTHTGEKPYKCSYCNKRFTQTSDWRTHERLHTGIKPFHCDVCDKRFNQSNGLNMHLQSHGEDENLFHCMFCKKTFAKKVGLSKHLFMCKKKV